MNSTEPNHTDVIIIGSGPAAYTAAIYCSRAELKTIVFEGDMSTGMTPGGQLTTTTDVDNFPGFPDGVDGYTLVDNMKIQALKYGTTVISETVTKCDVTTKQLQTNTLNNWTFKSLIIATGAKAKRLENLSGLDTYWNKGISACAVCDGALPLFRNKPLVVVGGGDSAMEEALFLTKYASHVYIIVRRNTLRASKIMAKNATKNPKISFIYNSNVLEAKGDEYLQQLIISDNENNKTTLDCAGLFFGIGHEPFSHLFTDQIMLTESGYIITKPDSTQVYNKDKTEINGIFACGDVQDFKWRQAITAAGTGCMSALEAEKYLSELDG